MLLPLLFALGCAIDPVESTPPTTSALTCDITIPMTVNGDPTIVGTKTITKIMDISGVYVMQAYDKTVTVGKTFVPAGAWSRTDVTVGPVDGQCSVDGSYRWDLSNPPPMTNGPYKIWFTAVWAAS